MRSDSEKQKENAMRQVAEPSAKEIPPIADAGRQISDLRKSPFSNITSSQELEKFLPSSISGLGIMRRDFYPEYGPAYHYGDGSWWTRRGELLIGNFIYVATSIEATKPASDKHSVTITKNEPNFHINATLSFSRVDFWITLSGNYASQGYLDTTVQAILDKIGSVSNNQ